MITIAICDDDHSASLTLKRQINDVISYSQFNDLTYHFHICSTSKDLLFIAETTAIDILFLDIQLEKESGLEIANTFKETYPNTIIIFVSNFESYVFYSMRFRPFRFLRKSHLKNELYEATIAALQFFNHPSTTLLLHSNSEHRAIKIQKIVYIEKEKKSNYILYHLGNEIIKERANLSDIENTLSKKSFCKINSGTLINMKHVIKADASSVEMSTHVTLPVSPRYSTNLIKQLINHFNQTKELL